jgi:hypothetical protein
MGYKAFADSLVSVRICDHQFAEVCTKAEIVAANEADDLLVFHTNEGEACRRFKATFQNVGTPAILPKTGFGFAVAAGAWPGYRPIGFRGTGMELATGMGLPPLAGNEERLSFILKKCQVCCRGVLCCKL